MKLIILRFRNLQFVESRYSYINGLLFFIFVNSLLEKNRESLQKFSRFFNGFN